VGLQDDTLTHLYTLIVKPDNTYEVKIDNKKEESGTLEADWDFLAPKMIKVIIIMCMQFMLVNVRGVCCSDMGVIHSSA